MIVIARLILLAALLANAQAQAQPYPSRTVTIVVTSAAGALTDTLTRAVGQRLSQKWGQSVVVENRGGGGHTLATTAVTKAEPDGHTLLSSETGFITSQPHLYSKGKLPFTPDEFVAVAGYAGIPQALLVHPSVPAQSVAEFIALAKQKPAGITYGTAGIGSALHTAALLLESLVGIQLTAVHYRGAAPALNDLIAGHINAIIMGPSVALPSVAAGKIKMLAFAGARRVPQYPDVPTLAETVPGYEANVSFGLFARADTPQPIVDKINADVQEIIAEPAFHKQFLEPLVVQPLPGPQAAFAEYIRRESAKWAKVIAAAKLKIE